jgi:hypothetical protein
MKLFELHEVLRFLAQSNDELVLFLPGYEEDLLYRRVDEDGFYEDVQLPSKAAGITCIRVIHVLFPDVDNEGLASLIGEILSFILIMIGVSIQGEYLWMVDKNNYMIHGPYDDSWAILRRLASQGLRMIGAEIRPPQTPFGEFIKLGGFSMWKVVPTSND